MSFLCAKHARGFENKGAVVGLYEEVFGVELLCDTYVDVGEKLIKSITPQ